MKELSIHQNFKVGDKVCYAASFLNQIQDYSADSAERVGTVEAVVNNEPKRCSVNWADGRNGLILSCHLWPADKKHLEPR